MDGRDKPGHDDKIDRGKYENLSVQRRHNPRSAHAVTRAGRRTQSAGRRLDDRELKELAPRFEKRHRPQADIQFASTPKLIKLATSDPFDLGVVPGRRHQERRRQRQIRRRPHQHRARRLRRRGEGRRAQARRQHARGAQGGAAQRPIDRHAAGQRGRRLCAENFRPARHRRADQGQAQGAGRAPARSRRPSPMARPSSACFSPTC